MLDRIDVDRNRMGIGRLARVSTEPRLKALPTDSVLHRSVGVRCVCQGRAGRRKRRDDVGCSDVGISKHSFADKHVEQLEFRTHAHAACHGDEKGEGT